MAFPYDEDGGQSELWRTFSYGADRLDETGTTELGRAWSGRGAWTPDGAFVFLVDDDGVAKARDVVVGVLERPQSRSGDFYRELGDIFSVKLKPSNRYGGFRALRERWKAHVASSRIKPVLLVDEAQEMAPDVLSELRILSSTGLPVGNTTIVAASCRV